MCSKNAAAMALDCSAGLITTGFPATSAATVIPHKMARRKFHGAITAVGPAAFNAVLMARGSERSERKSISRTWSRAASVSRVLCRERSKNELLYFS